MRGAPRRGLRAASPSEDRRHAPARGCNHPLGSQRTMNSVNTNEALWCVGAMTSSPMTTTSVPMTCAPCGRRDVGLGLAKRNACDDPREAAPAADDSASLHAAPPQPPLHRLGSCRGPGPFPSSPTHMPVDGCNAQPAEKLHADGVGGACAATRPKGGLQGGGECPGCRRMGTNPLPSPSRLPRCAAASPSPAPRAGAPCRMMKPQ